MNFTYAVKMYPITCPEEEEVMATFSTLAAAEAYLQRQMPHYSNCKLYIETL